MADEARERKRERRQRRQQLERFRQRRTSRPGTAALEADATLQENDTTHQKGPGKKIREQDTTGLKYFDKLAPLLQRLHDDACTTTLASETRPATGNYISISIAC